MIRYTHFRSGATHQPESNKTAKRSMGEPRSGGGAAPQQSRRLSSLKLMPQMPIKRELI